MSIGHLQSDLERNFPLAGHEKMGFDRGDIEQIRRFRRDQRRRDCIPQVFPPDLHAGLVRNPRKLVS